MQFSSLSRKQQAILVHLMEHGKSTREELKTYYPTNYFYFVVGFMKDNRLINIEKKDGSRLYSSYTLTVKGRILAEILSTLRGRDDEDESEGTLF